jgi:hypothetical protein
MFAAGSLALSGYAVVLHRATASPGEISLVVGREAQMEQSQTANRNMSDMVEPQTPAVAATSAVKGMKKNGDYLPRDAR